MRRPSLPRSLLLLLLVPVGGAFGQTLQGNDCTAAGAYTLCQNLWGASSGVGSQTTTLNSANGNSASWSTKYTWSNSPNNVKSYPNLYHNTAKGMQLQDIVSAPTSWQWNYQSASDDLRADVSYDIWFGVPQSGDPASSASSYEIMIWLSDRGGVGGIGDTIVQSLQLAGHNWSLKHGPNSNWDVFSFITAEGDITNFNADLNDFFQYLIDQQGVAKSQYIQAIQTGTEPFTGSAELVINNFSVDVSTQEDASTSAAATPTTSATSTNPPASSTSSSEEESTSSRGSHTSSVATSSPSGHVSSTSSGHASSSTVSGDPAAQTSDTPVRGGVQNAGGGQCRLTQPTQRSLTRRAKRSWVSRMFQ
ncbi:concanavalin A-like lectin/glucanase [Lentinus tigrinus ALCF2SS1-7]|uniref:Concanavalin A-like lectin/glucanase n=1 Tax=Lentinus tigrinus ALCF2SS1-6 TaxID=1328759 RepID=A0A5C2S081_9APHY|nr:concanavalin A-like lectin/glucanase [Lentinus tigrinus ALCF2SS1-6]RPD71607.1 concanavalin A-like lectin/glucanase [Lentinus tigrinus ALCF2SS1-7]